MIPMNVMVQGGLVDLIAMNVMVQGGLVGLIPTSTTRLFFHIFTFIFCGRRGTFWHRPSFCVAGVALLYMDCPFTWQAWDFMTWLKRVKFSYEAFFVLVSLWNAFFFQSLAPVSKSDVCVYGGVSMRCLILCSKVMQNGCVLK